MKKLLYIIGGLVLTAAIAGAYFFPLVSSVVQNYGTYSPVAGQTYRLQSSITSTQTTVTLTSFTDPVSNLKYTMSLLNSDIEYGTIDPQTSQREFISFTGITQNSDGSATLTGVTRGLSGFYPYTASSTLDQSHSSQSIFILSNPPQLTNEYANRNNDDTITGVWNFASLPTTTETCVSGDQFCAKSYIDGIALNGGATSTEANLGLVQLSTAANTGTSQASSTVGQAFGGAPIVIENKFATTTDGTLCTGGTWNCIVAAASGKISQAWLDLTQAFTFSTTTSYVLNAGTITATSSISTPSITINGATQSTAYAGFGGSGVDGALSITSGTTNIDLQGKTIFIKNYTSISITGTGELTFTNPNVNGTLIILKSQGNVTLTSSAAPMIDASGLGGGNIFTGSFASTTSNGGGGSSCSASCTPTAGAAGGSGMGTTSAMLDRLSLRQFVFATGSNGGAGSVTSGSAPGGIGGGALYIEDGGAWDFTTANGISIAGKAGTKPAGGSGGGGGAGGSFLAIYNSLTANTGTITITGGAGGDGSGSVAGGAGGTTSYGTGIGGTGGTASCTSGTGHSAGGGGGQYFATAGGSNGTADSGACGTASGGGGGAAGIATTTQNYFF